MSFSRAARVLFRGAGLEPARCAVVVADDDLRLRMGWMFSLTAPLAEVASATSVPHRWWWGEGAHLIGSRSWIANGSTHGLVDVRFRRPIAARAAAMPVKVERLVVGVEDPEGLVGFLSAP